MRRVSEVLRDCPSLRVGISREKNLRVEHCKRPCKNRKFHFRSKDCFSHCLQIRAYNSRINGFQARKTFHPVYSVDAGNKLCRVTWNSHSADYGYNNKLFSGIFVTRYMIHWVNTEIFKLLNIYFSVTK